MILKHKIRGSLEDRLILGAEFWLNMPLTYTLLYIRFDLFLGTGKLSNRMDSLEHAGLLVPDPTKTGAAQGMLLGDDY